MFRFDFTVNDAQGPALQGVEAYVCTQPASTGSIPPSPLATLYTDSGGGTQLANPVITDGLGNGFFYAQPGLYTIVYFDPQGRIPTTVFPDQTVASPGAGSVISVALTMPAEFSVAGSPVTTTGTLAVTKANQNANLVYAGPSSGVAAAPGFRTLVSADLPGGTGTVTSVAVTLTLPNSVFSGSVSGSPLTTSGTINITVGFANQPANTVLAGPTSGGVGPIAARFLVGADVFENDVVDFSATPVFDASFAAHPLFQMTLTGNVTSSSVVNGVAGQHITFCITQDGTGGRTFAWPSNFRGASMIAPDANSVSAQEFFYTGSVWRPTGPGATNST